MVNCLMCKKEIVTNKIYSYVVCSDRCEKRLDEELGDLDEYYN